MDGKVAILMSTYNGEKYIEEQIESIENQTYSNFTLIIRDDASKDGTIEVINRLMKKYNNIALIEGKNIGPAKSFLSILKSTYKYGEFDYFAFSDQDDVWLNKKVDEAIRMIKECENVKEPVLYFSDTILVDKELNKLPSTRIIKKEKIIPMNAFIENLAIGCTIVFNNELKMLLEKIELEEIENRFMHDDLAYKIAAVTGKIVYGEESFILYRQHENNVIGSSSNYIEMIKKRKKSIKRNIKLRSKMSAYILNKYNDVIDEKYKSDLKKIAKYDINRLKLLVNFKISRINFIDDILYRIMIISNLL